VRLLIGIAYACLLLLAFVGGVLLGIARAHHRRISALEREEGITVTSNIHALPRKLRERMREWWQKRGKR
jgi:hypothetical protein